MFPLVVSQDFLVFLPEFFYICSVFGLLLWILPFRETVILLGKTVTTQLIFLVIEIHLVTMVLLTNNLNSFHTLFYSNLISTNYTVIVKLCILGCTVLFFSVVANKVIDQFATQLEFSLLLMFIIFALCLLVSSNDLLTLYLSIEMQSLCLYVLTSFKQSSHFSSEAGLKYFILGALSSSMLLFGISLIYGATGHTNYLFLAKSILTMTQTTVVSHTLVLGLVLVLSAFLFKLAAVPFHIWSPDVYEGAPFVLLVFLSLIPKLSFFGIFVKLLYVVFFDLYQIWQPILLWTSVVTILFSSGTTLYQKKIKRFLAYSSINHVGYMLLGLSTGTLLGLHAFFFYLFTYLIVMFMFFGVLVFFPKNLTYLTDLLVLRTHPFLKVVILVIFFSMAGLPPLLGFFSKFYVLLASIESQFYIVAAILILCSTLSAFYYLRIIKIVQFELVPRIKDKDFLGNTLTYFYLVSSTFLIVFFIVSPNFLLLQTQYLVLLL